MFFLCLLIGAAFIAGTFFICREALSRRFALCAVAVVLLLEVFAFNWQAFRLVGGKYEMAELNFDKSGVILNSENATVELDAVNRRVGTLEIAFEMKKGVEKIPFTVDVSDETTSHYRKRAASGTLYPSPDGICRIVCEFNGEVSRLRLNFTIPDEGTLTVTGVTVNSPFQFSPSPVRVALICAAAFLLYALFFAGFMRRPVSHDGLLLLRCFICGLLIICIAAAAGMSSRHIGAKNIGEAFRSTNGNQMTKELVDAFEAGQTALLDEPSPELLAMENPYDRVAREELDIPAKWDHCLYNGRYYSYYGIAPVLTLFLPYHLATGYYFPSFAAVLLYGCAGMIFLGLLYYELIKRYFSAVALNLAVSGAAVLLASCGVWFCFASPIFYEIAQSSGFAFTAAGLYFLARSGVMKREERVALPSACLSSVMLALAVLCRPTLAVYCVAALVFIVFGALSLRGQKRRMAAYLTCSLAPFILFGAVQMAYNYLRFGSPLDFGIQYSLTINDFTHTEFHLRFALIGFWNFLFIPPNITDTFPYFQPTFDRLGVNGYYFVANSSAIGIAFRALPVFSYLFAPRAVRALPKGERRRLLMPLAVCVAAPAVIIFSIWESGYGVRYCADFSAQIVLGALALCFCLLLRRKEGEMRRFLECVFIAGCVISVYINFAHIFKYYLANLN